MRYYLIIIKDPDGNEVTPSSLDGIPLSSLDQAGLFNIAALNIEFDIPVSQMHQPSGQGFLRIWGLSVKDIGRAFNLNPVANNGKFYSIEVYGGMSFGFPLANPSQARLLVKASILQAFGNWIGLQQTIDFIFAPYIGTTDNPINIVLNWLMNTPLEQALRTCLSTAFPTAALEFNLSPRLSQNHDEPGIYGSLTQLATYLNPLSKRIITDAKYAGVSIAYDGSTIRVFDATTTPPTINIDFTDLVGQPTWIAVDTIQVVCVLRGDLDIDSLIFLPQTLVTNSAASLAGLTGNPANSLTFTGRYRIIKLHHYGNFRQPDAASWTTVIEAIPNTGGVAS